MVKVNKDNLEEAFDKKEAVKMPKEIEIGFHQGALNTLVNERNELFKIIQNAEAVMQAHLKRLEELGVKIQQKKTPSS